MDACSGAHGDCCVIEECRANDLGLALSSLRGRQSHIIALLNTPNSSFIVLMMDIKML